MNILRATVLSASLLFLASVANASSVITFTTDHTNKNTQLDINHSLAVDFTVASTGDYQLIGDFTMKRGKDTSAPVTFGVYDGTNHAGSLLGSLSRPPSDFTQQYDPVTFDIVPTSIHLIAGQNYSVWLHTDADTQGDKQYFIKGDSLLIRGNGTIPEPTSVAMVSIGLGAAMLFLRRRKSA